MTNYWPLNNNYNDIISAANLFNPVSVSFAADRYSSPNSALSLNGGSILIPEIYLNQDYTISVWVKLLSYGICERY